MIKLQKPIIFSFEYKKGQNKILQEVLSYVKKNEIKTVMITNLIPINIVKKIDADFISIDIDFYELNYNKLNLIKLYNNQVGQIRIIIDESAEFNSLNIFLEKIRGVFSGSIVLLYKFSRKSFNYKRFINYLSCSKKLKLSLSLLPSITKQSDYNFFVNLFSKFKKEINNGIIFIDSPFIYKKILNKDNYCPGLNLMCHVDYDGDFKICKFDHFRIGNIGKASIQKLWQQKNKIIKDKFKNQLINKCILMGFNNNPYAMLSKIYDQVMAGKEKMYNDYVNFVRNKFSDKNIKILDLACGTGTLIKMLSKYYKNIEGVESSKEMAQLAKKKTGRKIYVQDMSEFKINKKYDLILCTFDSLNYLLDDRMVNKTIKNFYQHLNHGGSLIFDINPINKFKNHFNKISEYKIGKIKTKWISSYKKPFWKLEIEFKEDNNTYKETHHEKFYSISSVREILKNNKFKKIKISKGGLLNKELKENRIFFTAEK